MYQQEIKFFWPLTEQIPLDLDYTDCARFTSTNISGHSIVSMAGTGLTYSNQFKMTENQTTMVVLKKPNIIRKFLFKMLGLKWEVR